MTPNLEMETRRRVSRTEPRTREPFSPPLNQPHLSVEMSHRLQFVEKAAEELFYVLCETMIRHVGKGTGSHSKHTQHVLHTRCRTCCVLISQTCRNVFKELKSRFLGQLVPGVPSFTNDSTQFTCETIRITSTTQEEARKMKEVKRKETV